MRRGLLCLSYVLAILAVAIVGDRIATQILYGHTRGFAPAAASYYHPTVAQKLQQLEERSDDQRDPLFIGNSLTMLGIDPASFDRELERQGVSVSSYNLALPSIGVTFWAEFFERYWRDPMPQHLLLGIQARDVNPRGTALTVDFINRFFAEDQSENGLQGVADDALSKAFGLWERRGTLFTETEHAPIGTEPGSTDITVRGPQGFGITGDPFTFTPRELRANRRKALPVEGPPFALDPAAVTALDELAAQQDAIGGDLILHTFPVFYDSEPEGAEGVEADFVDAMERYAASRDNVEFVDAAARTRDGFSAGDYVDENHFDRAAARRYSAQLADLLVPLLDQR